jgi:hypothetical protein
MRGIIAIEEAFQVPELAHQALNHAPAGAAADTLAANLVDIDKQRLQKMDEFGVDMEVLAHSSWTKPPRYYLSLPLGHKAWRIEKPQKHSHTAGGTSD